MQTKELKLNIEFNLKFNDVVIAITALLFERPKNYRLIKETIDANITAFLLLGGTRIIKKFELKYRNHADYDNNLSKAKKIAYQYYSEICEEENSVMFIKSLD